MASYQQVIAASTLIHTGAGYLAGLVVSVDGATAVTVTCYDNTAASGTKIFEVNISPESVQQPFQVFFDDRFAPRFQTGLYVSIAGLGGVVNLWARGV
jgi:hypothetical protein